MVLQLYWALQLAAGGFSTVTLLALSASGGSMLTGILARGLLLYAGNGPSSRAALAASLDSQLLAVERHARGGSSLVTRRWLPWPQP